MLVLMPHSGVTRRTVTALDSVTSGIKGFLLPDHFQQLY
jgi:hypothetical protein